MTLNFSYWQLQAFMAAASRHQSVCHASRHPPPRHRIQSSADLQHSAWAGGRSAGCWPYVNASSCAAISPIGPRSP
jgi:hypothetical protein